MYCGGTVCLMTHCKPLWAKNRCVADGGGGKMCRGGRIYLTIHTPIHSKQRTCVLT